MKTAKIPVYGNIALTDYKIDYTLRCLEYICSVSSPLRTPQTLTHIDTDKCTLNCYPIFTPPAYHNFIIIPITIVYQEVKV